MNSKPSELEICQFQKRID